MLEIEQHICLDSSGNLNFIVGAYKTCQILNRLIYFHCTFSLCDFCINNGLFCSIFFAFVNVFL